jgi:hypothetical protein
LTLNDKQNFQEKKHKGKKQARKKERKGNNKCQELVEMGW